MTPFVGKPSLPSGRALLVWDPVVRLFHWIVVAGCLLDLFVLDDGKTAHRFVGYLVAMALMVRILWGFVGVGHARFSDFVPSPAGLTRYLRALLLGKEPRFVGHNPAGAVVMLTLMGLLAAVSITGWLLTLDVYFGSEILENFHTAIANAILVLAITHAAAALFESWRHKENLVWSMVTGRKRE